MLKFICQFQWDIKMKIYQISLGLAFCAILIACAQTPLAVIPARQIETQKITLGSVQSQVKKGASSADVINALSSPNIVTSNSDGSETWVYDKLSTEVEAAGGSNSGVLVKSTRTMMVVVKFDKNHIVENVQYRQTSY